MATTTTKRKPRTTTKAKTPRKPAPRKTATKREPFQYKNNLIGIVVLFILALAIFQTGVVGVFLANCLRYGLGGSYQVFAAILAGFFVYFAVYGKWLKIKNRFYLGLVLTYLGAILWSSMNLFNRMNTHSEMVKVIGNMVRSDFANQATTTRIGGGALGAFMYSVTYPLFSNWGTILIALVFIIGGIIVFFNLPLQAMLGVVFNGLGLAGQKTAKATQAMGTKMQERSEQMREEIAATREAERQARISGVMNDPKLNDAELVAQKNQASLVANTSNDFDEPFDIDALNQPQAKSAVKEEPVEPNITWPGAKPAPSFEPEPRRQPAEPKQAMPTPKPVSAPMSAADTSDSDPIFPEVSSAADRLAPQAEMVSHVDAIRDKEVKAPEADEAEGSLQPKIVDDSDYVLPTTELLAHVPATDQTGDYDAIKEKAVLLQQTLKSFGIDVTVENVALGPTVTQYEIKPAIGTRLNKITGLAQDLALALAATSVRIEAPIPGKSLVGIEVPNQQQAMVGFRDLMESAPKHEKDRMTVPLGRGLTGDVVMADITKMPHLLIAGQTGSGKSVSINGIIAGLLMQNKPSELKMVMVDPKQVELSVYNDIPHLLTPVVSEPRKAARALQKVAKIMDDRYKLLATVGVRKIDEYNKKIEEYNAEHSEGNPKMPHIVVIVDEMADLMIQVKSEVEQPIIRIAQLGRAAGIHMILATQRPTVDVITGLIKANVPSRIAFAVASGMDSRTILDKNGAEKLLGHGDMLFEPSGKSSQRVQGAFLSDQDVVNLVDFIKAQTEAEYDDSLTKEIETEAEDADADEPNNKQHDSQWNEVIQFIMKEQKASTSLLQRRFGFGYNRAARIVDQLEEQGFVGPQNGSKPREVYVTDNSSGVEHRSEEM
ncbi:DNA translocase FtsK [Periweissella cryptocerci]|uniref:DNA translocase FtsK n=1 Tax=Periweissella cryptocerci TaxID=2506420 RepID=A0A4P6YS57_9LACO|nr:DNA translocase FtsK [Periweissella cryptocerci]QBO35514.1 DNA translocase FtsK [Periweissella cryptocerci]